MEDIKQIIEEKTGGEKKNADIIQVLKDYYKAGVIPAEIIKQITEYIDEAEPHEVQEAEKLWSAHKYPDNKITWYRSNKDIEKLKLSPAALKILTLYEMGQSQDGYLYITNKEIEELTGLSKNTIKKALSELYEQQRIYNITNKVYKINPNSSTIGTSWNRNREGIEHKKYITLPTENHGTRILRYKEEWQEWDSEKNEVITKEKIKDIKVRINKIKDLREYIKGEL